MLFPGAIYIISFLSGVVVLAVCIVLAFWIGAAVFKVSQILIKRTKAWKICAGGAENANRWWFNSRFWAGLSMIVGFIIFSYTAAGPYWAFIKYLGGI